MSGTVLEDSPVFTEKQPASSFLFPMIIIVFFSELWYTNTKTQ